MDFLRSCYSTKMVLDESGIQYPVTWYFVPDGTPFFPGEHFASLNWERPNYGAGPLGEVPTATRAYYKGGQPAWLKPDFFHQPVGALPWYATGAPAPLDTPALAAWDGTRAILPLNPPGIFPTPVPYPYQLQSAARGIGTGATWLPSQYQGWQFPPSSPYIVGFAPVPYFGQCPTPKTLALFGLKPPSFVSGTFFPLRCINYFGGVSIWIDPSGACLDPGDTLTLTGV